MVSPRILLVLLVSCEADVFTSAPQPSNDDAAPQPQADSSVIAPSNDASVDPPDSAPPPPACDTKKPFGAPQPVGGLGAGPYKEGARLSPEQLTILFASNSSGSIQLYQATRPDPMSAFGNITSVPGMPNTLPSFAPSLSADRLTMVFGQQQLNGEMHLVMATRPDAKSLFDAPVPLTALNGVVNSTAEPYLRADAQELYFVSNRVDPKALHLYRSKPPFEVAERMTEIATANGERYPAVTGDALVLYFSTFSNTQKGGADVWVARRTSTADPFGVPTLVSELNSSQDDDVTWISPDECVAYVRRGDATVGSIFVARR